MTPWPVRACGLTAMLAVVLGWPLGPLSTAATGRTQEKTMNLQPDVLALSTLAAPAVGVDRIKLLQAEAGLRLLGSSTAKAPDFGSRTTLSVLPLQPAEGSWTAFATIDHVLPPPPAWDLVLDSQGRRPAWVNERALGASYVLQVNGFDRKMVDVPTGHDAVSYTAPRFAGPRGDQATRQLLTIADKQQAVLFERAGDGSYTRTSTLCHCNDALVLPYRDGHLLLFKLNQPGPVRGVRTAPGRLHLQTLDGHYSAKGPARELFPDLVVYDFAADADADRIGLLLTTADGTRLALAAGPGGPWAAQALAEDDLGQALGSPSLVLTPGGSVLALLQRAGNAKAQILIGHSRLAVPR